MKHFKNIFALVLPVTLATQAGDGQPAYNFSSPRIVVEVRSTGASLESQFDPLRYEFALTLNHRTQRIMETPKELLKKTGEHLERGWQARQNVNRQSPLDKSQSNSELCFTLAHSHGIRLGKNFDPDVPLWEQLHNLEATKENELVLDVYIQEENQQASELATNNDAANKKKSCCCWRALARLKNLVRYDRTE